MSIFNALTASVTGLQAQSFALENISNNISNVRTPGYKRVDTSFQEMVGDAALRQQLGGSVSSFSTGTNDIDGTSLDTAKVTNFALQGPGFAMVTQKSGGSDSAPRFGGANLYTRRGDFDLRFGHLVNGAGQYLMGYAVDPATGKPTTNTPEVIDVPRGFLAGKASTSIDASLNLPPAAALWTAGRTPPLPSPVTPTGTPTSGDFVANSFDGKTVTMYDPLGKRVDVSLRWTKIATSPQDKWALYYDSNRQPKPEDSQWSLFGTVEFDSKGRVLPGTPPFSANMASRGLGTITFDPTKGNVQQITDPKAVGDVNVNDLKQDGYAGGDFYSASVSADGMVVANYTNGQTLRLAQVAIAQFNAPNMLKREGGGAFSETLESGAPFLSSNGTTLVAGAVEGSNADIAQEFSKMIVTQQAYSANTRVITTAQQLLQDTINIIR